MLTIDKVSHRFFVPQESIKGNSVVIPNGTGQQIRKVLRLCSGDEIIVIDEKRGEEYLVKLNVVTKRKVIGTIIKGQQIKQSQAVNIVIGQGVPKGNKMDMVVQKGTELGVTLFVPLFMERCIVKLNAGAPSRRLDRLHRIAMEAAEQSGRNFIPIVSEPKPLDQFCYEERGAGIKIIFWEKEKKRGLKEIFSHFPEAPRRVAAVIGPEGGITDEEVEIARKRGFLTAGLGRNLLRTETVTLAVTSIIQFQYGDMGEP